MENTTFINGVGTSGEYMLGAESSLFGFEGTRVCSALRMGRARFSN